MTREAEHDLLTALIAACDTVGRQIAGADHDDRLAASYPFLTMLSVATCGWLLEREARAAGDDDFGRAKRATVRFYLDQIVPEAMGLRAAASASAAVLYELPPEAFAA